MNHSIFASYFAIACGIFMFIIMALTNHYPFLDLWAGALIGAGLVLLGWTLDNRDNS